jgi:PKD repeat protein
MTGKKFFQAALIMVILLAAPVSTFAQDSLSVTVTTNATCDSVDFSIDLQGGEEPYTIFLNFGDTETYQNTELSAGILNLSHIYPSQGVYNWTLTVADIDFGLIETAGEVTIDGPIVDLTSIPSLPLLTIEGGEASIDFLTTVTGGETPYTYEWDLDGDGLPDPGFSESTAAYSYTSAGNYTAAVTVSDSGICGLTHTDTLTVVVVDPEADPQDACHPTAQKIAEAVSILSLEGRAEQTYTCEDIFAIFEGALLGNHIGFGRLWHAYQLTQTIPDLTWEEIRDWKLDGSSWGALTQLNRFADTLDEYGIRDLFDLVLSGENSVGDIRTAARAAVRYEADFEYALSKLGEGANAGEVGQFFKLAQDLEMDPAALDEFLGDGMSLAELRQSAKMAERTGSDLESIIEAKSLDHSWGEISRAYRMAGEGISAEDILAFGVKEYREQLREEEHAIRKQGMDQKTADRLMDQYQFTGDINALYEECEGSWSCVRKALREQSQTQSAGNSDKDQRTAERLFAQYGVDMDTIWLKFNGICGGNWNCVRAELREMTRESHGKNK